MNDKIDHILNHNYLKLHESMMGRVQDIEKKSSESFALAKESQLVVKLSIDELRRSFIASPLISVEEEIVFFKEIKPSFYCHWIYWHEVLNIEMYKPIAGKKNIEKYLIQQLQKLNYFFERHIDFYMYYRGGSVQFDEDYFTRNKMKDSVAHDVYLLDMDNSFSTSHDYLVSRILANEMLSKYLGNMMVSLGEEVEVKKKYSKSNLSWTSQKVALAELIYAFHASGVFDNSQIGLKKLAMKICECFDVKIGNIYKTLEEIRLRKKNRTTFLDSLRHNLLRKMDEDDEQAL